MDKKNCPKTFVSNAETHCRFTDTLNRFRYLKNISPQYPNFISTFMNKKCPTFNVDDTPATIKDNTAVAQIDIRVLVAPAILATEIH